MDKLDENDHPIAFIPKAMINDMELAGLLAHLLFEAFPPRVIGAVAGVSKSLYQGLQLRVQLRYFTGFPIIPC